MRCHFAFLVLLAVVSPLQAEVEPQSLIQEAGNAKDDRQRQAALEKLAALRTIEETLRDECSALANFAKQWNESGLKFYSASVRGKPHRAIGDYDFGVA